MMNLLLWPFRLVGSLIGLIFDFIGGAISLVFGLVGGIFGIIFSGAALVLVVLAVLAVVRWLVRSARGY